MRVFVGKMSTGIRLTKRSGPGDILQLTSPIPTEQYVACLCMARGFCAATLALASLCLVYSLSRLARQCALNLTRSLRIGPGLSFWTLILSRVFCHLALISAGKYVIGLSREPMTLPQVVVYHPFLSQLGLNVQHRGEQVAWPLAYGLWLEQLWRYQHSMSISELCSEKTRVLMILFNIMNGSFADCMRNTASDMLTKDVLCTQNARLLFLVVGSATCTRQSNIVLGSHDQ